MRFTEFAEDQFGTNPRRPARAGARHPRGHEPVERYRTVKEFDPGGSGDSGDYLRALASAWYNGVFDTGSLPKGIKTQQDVERLLNRGIVCPDGKTRKLHIDYNSDFDGVVIYSDDYYEHGDYDDTIDSRTGQKWGPYDHMEFKDEELDEGVAEGIETVHGKKYSVDPNKYYVWAWDGAAVLYGEYDDIQDAKNNLPRIEQRAIKRLGPFAKGKFEIASGKDLLRRYEKSGVAEGSLNEFAPGGGGDDDHQDPYGVPKPEHYDRSIDFFGQFEADHFDEEDMNDATGEFKGYWYYDGKPRQIAYFKFDNPRRTGSNHPGVGWYYEPQNEGMAEGALNEFAPDSNDGGEEDVLHRYARMWWAGDEATQMQIEKVLDRMGWEIGEDEGSYDNGGVFVVRAGDENGNSYISWPAEELDEGAPVTTTPGSQEPGGAVDNFKQQMANRTEVDYQKQQAEVAEGDRKPEPPEADYGADYQDMVSRVKKLAGLGPLKTVYDPRKRVYRNVPTAVQPRK